MKNALGYKKNEFCASFSVKVSKMLKTSDDKKQFLGYEVFLYFVQLQNFICKEERKKIYLWEEYEDFNYTAPGIELCQRIICSINSSLGEREKKND